MCTRAWLFFLLASVVFSAPARRRRRVVDCVFSSSIMKSDRTEMLPVFAERLSIHAHTTTETDCRNIVKDLKNSGEDDFLLLVSVQRINCSEEICKKNFANIVLPADSEETRSVTYGCGKTEEGSLVSWETVASSVFAQQRENVLDNLPQDYIEDEKGLLSRGTIAGLVIMALLIVGLVVVLILSNIRHSKEVKALKKGAGSEEHHKKPEIGPHIETNASTKSAE